MASPDPQTPSDARVDEARREAIRQELMARPMAPPDERRRRGGAGVASLRGGMFLAVIALILGGLYVLKTASRALRLR